MTEEEKPDGININEHMTQTIDLLEVLINADGVHSIVQRQNMYAAQILLIEIFGPADIRNLNKC